MFTISIKNMFKKGPKTPASPIPQAQVVSTTSKVEIGEEEHALLAELFDAAHDPALMGVRRRVSMLVRTSQVCEVRLSDAKTLLEFARVSMSLAAPPPVHFGPPCPPLIEAVSELELSSPPPRPVGISDFCVIRKLGAGTGGTVYLAQHRSTLRMQAIKKVDKGFLDSEHIAEILREQRALKATRGLGHLLSLDASFHNADAFYLVTPFLPGGDLRAQLNRQGKVPVARTMFYVAETMLALYSLHSAGIIHRDIKPDNVFLDAQGHVVLGDLGICRQFDMPSGDARKSRLSALAPGLGTRRFPGIHATSTFGGTPAYTAPEVFQGRAYSFDVDVWSLGVTAYELIYGATPFKDTSDYEEISRSVQDDVLHFDEAVEVDAAVKSFLIAALQKDPKRRLSLQNMFQHPCFRVMDWAKLAAGELEAPWVPSPEAVFSDIKAAKANPVVFNFSTGTHLVDSNDLYPDFNFVAPALSADVKPVAAVPWVVYKPSSPALTPSNCQSVVIADAVSAAALALEVLDTPPVTPLSAGSPALWTKASGRSACASGEFFGTILSLLSRRSSCTTLSSHVHPTVGSFSVADDLRRQSPASALFARFRSWMKSRSKAAKY
ncbi:kinase-like protein [Auriscalpium vulgare]|uniref:Kinase-like protein n=1 Tax=Auriscalpium vulgare TaxID=40419 RepID=A0ACB8RBW3_9AGAM|nr:kinase-like protein [Auriscalpium vulgare]